MLLNLSGHAEFSLKIRRPSRRVGLKATSKNILHARNLLNFDYNCSQLTVLDKWNVTVFDFCTFRPSRFDFYRGSPAKIFTGGWPPLQGSNDRPQTDALNLIANQPRFSPPNCLENCPFAGFKTTCQTIPLAHHENEKILKVNLMTVCFQKTLATRDILQKVP